MEGKHFSIPSHTTEDIWTLIDSLIHNGGFVTGLKVTAPKKNAVVVNGGTIITVEKECLIISCGQHPSFHLKFNLETFYRFLYGLKEVMLFCVYPKEEDYAAIVQLQSYIAEKNINLSPMNTGDTKKLMDALNKSLIQVSSDQARFLRKQFILLHLQLVKLYCKIADILNVSASVK